MVIVRKDSDFVVAMATIHHKNKYPYILHYTIMNCSG